MDTQTKVLYALGMINLFFTFLTFLVVVNRK